MRRIDQIRTMSASEIADGMLASGTADHFDFCDSNHECGELDEIPEEMCRQCLIEWLQQEV